MPVHDWTRVSAGTFHDFHSAWIVEIRNALNTGVLPPDYYAMAEQVAGEVGPDVLALQARPQNGQPDAEEPQGAIAVIAAGTGLGEAALMWNGRRYQAVASEGGHADFAPRNELEIELLRYLAKQFGHVSYERILSGPGKVSLYQFLRERRHGEEPPWLTALLAGGDPSPVISEMALNGRSELCAQALRLFVSIYGAEAGNLALKYLARGGVYVGGGIAPTILPLLQDGAFTRAFADKGRLSALLSDIPIRVILEERTALFGAAYYGLARAS